MYNEADTIYDCLAAIAGQTSAPYEVLLVDNNSTDDTVAIANKFAFVTILHAQRQGVVHARTTGFNAARGDVIGRIDADTRVARDWVQTIQHLFETEDVAAFTGSVRYENILLARPLGWADSAVRTILSIAMSRDTGLQGANMAIRTKVWHELKGNLCHKAGLHEDFDLSLHLAKTRHRAKYARSLRATLQLRQAGSSWAEYANYFWAWPMTYLDHRRLTGLYILPFAVCVIVAYPLIHLLYVGFSSKRRHLYLHRVGALEQSRVNPATFVD